MSSHHRLASSLSRFIYNSNGTRTSLRMSSATNDQGAGAGSTSRDGGDCAALGRDAASGGVWQPSQGIRFHSSSIQAAQRTWRPDHGIVFSNSKHIQQPTTSLLEVGSYQRVCFTSTSTVHASNSGGYAPKKAPPSFCLHADEGNVFKKSFYDEEDAGVPMRIPTVTPNLGKPAPAARASSGQSSGSVKAPIKGQAKKQATAVEESNVKIGRSAKVLIGKDLVPTIREGLKAGTAAKEADVLNQRAGQAEDSVVLSAVTRSAPKPVAASPEMIESAILTQAIKISPKEKHSTRVKSSVTVPITAPQSSKYNMKPPIGKDVVEVQFKNPYLALQKVQSYIGSKPTGWVSARKIQVSKAFGASDSGNSTTQIRLMSPLGSATDPSHSSSTETTPNETHAPQDGVVFTRLNSANKKSTSDCLTTVERPVEVSTSQMASENPVNKASSTHYRYSPFTSQNPYPYSLPSMGLSSLKIYKTAHDEPVNSSLLAISSTDQMPLVEDLDPEANNLELIGEIDDPQESPWARNYELAEVEDCPFEGFQQGKLQGPYSTDYKLFSDTLFSVNDEGSGSSFRKPHDRVALGYGKLMRALKVVENVAESSTLQCHLRIMRNDVSVLLNELQNLLHCFRQIRRFVTEFDRFSTLNPESQELLLYLVNEKRVTSPFDDYILDYDLLILRLHDLERYYIYRSGSSRTPIGTMRDSSCKALIRRGKTIPNMLEMARRLWQICDEGYATQSRTYFDQANYLTRAIARGSRVIQRLNTELTNYWRENCWSKQDHRAFHNFLEKAANLTKQSSSMQPYFYAYQSVALKRSMEMAANAATPDLTDERTDLSGSAQAVTHRGWSSIGHRVQKKRIDKSFNEAYRKDQSLRNYKGAGKRTSYRRISLQSTQHNKYHTIQTSSYSREKLLSTLDPDGSSTAVRENDTTGGASNTINKSDVSDEAPSTDHGYLNYQIPGPRLREAMLASRSTGAAYWQYSLYEDATGKKPRVHYCKTIEATERIAQLFLGKEFVGFDIEWKPGATPSDGIKNNVSLVQLASEERIALFHIARYGKDGIENLVSPILRQIMEDPNITKVGVSVKADCTRLRKFMGIQSRGLLELSHLYKLARYSDGNVKKIDKRLVALAQQVEEHLQLPMWKGEVRSSDWTEDLSYQQIQYAASDSYAGLQLYNVMERKRKALVPTPPRPEHAELNLPIRLANGQTVATYDESEEVTNENPTNDSGSQPTDIEEIARDFLNIAIEDSEGSQPSVKLSKSTKLKSSSDKPPEIIAAEEWIQQWRATLPSDYKSKTTPAYLRAYFLWHHSDKEVLEAASLLRDPPLQVSTVSSYILEAVRIEKLPFDAYRLPEVLAHLPSGMAKGKYQSLRGLAN